MGFKKGLKWKKLTLSFGKGKRKIEYKKDLGWKACYDEQRNLYSAKRSWRGSYHLYEINKEIYDKLGEDKGDGHYNNKLIMEGRLLFESDDDYYTMPYYHVADEKYHELAPWSGAKWIADKTDVMYRRNGLVEEFPGLYLCFGISKKNNTKKVYGVFDKENNFRVDLGTMFPACSISKFVTAICVMKMQELKLIDIDDNVNKYLSQWKLLTLDGNESDASIRSLLSHTAGIIDDEDGFCGLRMGDPEVSLLDILDGKTKYNNRPARAEKLQGTSFEYSDAGYCVLQLMIQEVTGKAFEDAVQEMVFDGLELENSFFATPKNIETFNARMAIGYDEKGEPIPGKFPLVPDLAASGLWSTAEDLLVIAAEFLKALKGKSNLLQKETAQEMIKPVENFAWTGLGIFLDGEDTLVSKGWGENGQCMMKMHIKKGEISVAMTNMNPGVDQSESGIEWLVNCYTFFI